MCAFSPEKAVGRFLSLCLLFVVTGCGGGSGGNSPGGGPTGGGTSPPPPTYTVGGTVSGLTGTLVLQNNGGNDRSIATNGAFMFSTPIASGSNYNVTILSQPAGATCTVTNGTGTVSENVTNVAVACVPNAPPTVTLMASPTSITAGQSVQLSWTSIGATSCEASGGWSGSLAISGTQASGALNTTTSFSLVCSNNVGSTWASTIVTVMPILSAEVTATVVQAFRDRHGLTVPYPPIVWTGCPSQSNRQTWTSAVYVDKLVYRIFVYPDGTISSGVLPVQRPVGTFRTIVVAINRPTTNISDVLDNMWRDAQQRINDQHVAYATLIGLSEPIVKFENTNILAAVADVPNPQSRADVVAFLASRGISSEDFDLVLALDLDAANPAGGFASYGGDFAYIGYFFLRSDTKVNLEPTQLNDVAHALYHHEVGHIWGWEHEWTQCTQFVPVDPFITAPALFGWTDTDHDGVPEILDSTPYGG